MKKILVYDQIDDLAEYLRNHYHQDTEVIVCTNPKSVENIIGCIKIDLMISSLDRKKSDFKVVLPLIRKKFPTLPIIIIHTTDNHHSHAKAFGQVTFLSAPFNKYDLEDCLTKALNISSG